MDVGTRRTVGVSVITGRDGKGAGGRGGRGSWGMEGFWGGQGGEMRRSEGDEALKNLGAAGAGFLMRFPLGGGKRNSGRKKTRRGLDSPNWDRGPLKKRQQGDKRQGMAA